MKNYKYYGDIRVYSTCTAHQFSDVPIDNKFIEQWADYIEQNFHIGNYNIRVLRRDSIEADDAQIGDYSIALFPFTIHRYTSNSITDAYVTQKLHRLFNKFIQHYNSAASAA